MAICVYVCDSPRFGGDWQKRGLINRMTTENNYCTIGFACTFCTHWMMVYFAMNWPWWIVFTMKISRAFVYSAVSFMTIKAALIFLQEIVWSRIWDMNDHLLDMAITFSVYGVHMSLTLLLPMHKGNAQLAL